MISIMSTFINRIFHLDIGKLMIFYHSIGDYKKWINDILDTTESQTLFHCNSGIQIDKERKYNKICG